MLHDQLIKAQVVDIRNTRFNNLPNQVVVDTNVLYWMFYPHSGYFRERDQNPQPHQLSAYLSWWKRTKSDLVTTMLNLAELVNLIEWYELKALYLHDPKSHESGIDSIHVPGFSKQARYHYHAQCASTRGTVMKAMEKVRSSTKILAFKCEREMRYNLWTEEWKSSFTDYTDGYMVSCAKHCECTNLLSDDVDLITCNGITLYTANEKAIKTAQRTGNLR